MTALALSLIQSPTFRFVRERIEDRLMIIGAAICVLCSLGIALVLMRSALAACGEGESLLVYPYYSRKGIITGYEQRCGAPHTSCVMRAGTEATYDCSPFAIPRMAAASAR